MARIISQQKFGYFEYNFLDANLPGLGNKIFLKNRKFSYNITNQCFFLFHRLGKIYYSINRKGIDFDLVLIYVFKQKRLYSSTMTSCDISSSQVGVFGNSQENERLTRPIFHSGETGKHILCFCKYYSWMLNFCQKVYIIFMFLYCQMSRKIYE